MSSANGINGKKRNKPCESCRAHRRKCTVSNGTNCDRCKRLFLPCLFKFSLKPSVTKNTIATSITPSSTIATTVATSATTIECVKPKKSSRRPISQLRKSRLSEKVQILQQQITSMENQLQSLSTYARSNKQTRRDFWSLVIDRSIHGDLSLHTSVQNVGQLKRFLEETWPRFVTPDITQMIIPTSYGQEQGSLAINFRMFGVEKIFFNLMRSIPSDGISPSSDIPTTPHSVAEIAAAAAVARARPSYETNAISTSNIDDENPAFVFVKHNLINVFFGCDGYLSPSIVRTHFLDYLQSHPNSMLANAMVAYVACGLCRHVKLVNLPFTRQELGAACMAKARKQLEDAVFDDDQGEPTIEKMITLWLLANSFLMNLRNKEARTLTSMAWTMGIQLKDVYLPIVRQLDDPARAGELDSVTAAKAETWRRLFYVLRHLELSMYMVYDGLGDFSSIVMHSKVGYPKILPEEQTNPMLSKAVEIFRYLITLSTLPSGCDVSTRQEIIGQRLMAAALDKVSCKDLEFMESRLLQFWRSLPREYVLGSSPIGLLDDIIVQHCNDPHVLYLNKMYYIYWFVLHSRFMVDPAEADMVNSSMGRMDSERALLIVSLACDSLTKITVALYTHMPCAVEIHWLAIVADMLQKLTRCSQPEIKARAERNLASTLSILNSCMQLIFIDNLEENTASCSGSTCASGEVSDTTELSDSNSINSHSNYFNRQRATMAAAAATVATDIGRSESPATPPCGTATAAAALSAAYFKELKRQIGSVLTFNNHVI
ncbi:hypothetical protein BDA99DRAFT_554581 [Phascolomyces articulosus]|uniref:Zn(2)-C6 fungal-type domain-containing protein n=1 Tax=Phascolomyces articulosus TaxID=60185 RepID=A0AAD5KCX5_9FUNG|nr:hypothetical protein BDA99DRAFT_554581 [Phascolomyces articulosus]